MGAVDIMLQFYSIGVISLLSAMSPGPDFVVITKYALCESRRNAYFCALGIALGILVHMSYCLLGLALVITHVTHVSKLAVHNLQLF